MGASNTYSVVVALVAFAIGTTIRPAYTEDGSAGGREMSYSSVPPPDNCGPAYIKTVSKRSKVECAATSLDEGFGGFRYNRTARQCHLYSNRLVRDSPQDGGKFFAVENYLEENGETIQVYENGWLLFIRRQDGCVNFNRLWADYRKGFGLSYGEFWLGLETLHTLTASVPYRLRVEMTDWNDIEYFAEYSLFQVGPESTNYILSVSGYDVSSTAADSMTYHSGQDFSTPDVENNDYGCAVSLKAGWWYWGCHLTNPTGNFYPYETINSNGLCWYYTRNDYYSYKTMKMMIKP